MEKKPADRFTYPPNLRMLDLASMVSLYRSRGEPRRAPSGEYFACASSLKLIKEGKYWFGLHYSQTSWDSMLAKDSSGYPLTEVEFQILGLSFCPPDENNHRSQIESLAGFIPQLSFLIVNDLVQFGFLQEYDNGFLRITHNGNKALEGYARKCHDKKFSREMLPAWQGKMPLPKMEQAEKAERMQTRLF